MTTTVKEKRYKKNSGIIRKQHVSKENAEIIGYKHYLGKIIK